MARSYARCCRTAPHILFCGHVHEQGGLLSAPLHGGEWLELVAGAGHADPHQPAEHAYAWGRLSPAGLEYFPRTWNEKQHRFVPDRNSFKGMKQNGAVSVLAGVYRNPCASGCPELGDLIASQPGESGPTCSQY